MTVNKSSNPRFFYRCAVQRDQEARVLFSAGYTTGAIYLAGYAIECALKSLVLISTPGARRPEIIKSFRGSRAHDYGWLREQYRTNGGPSFPRPITKYFTVVEGWSTDIRYNPATVTLEEANDFLVATEAILIWAKGRL